VVFPGQIDCDIIGSVDSAAYGGAEGIRKKQKNNKDCQKKGLDFAESALSRQCDGFNDVSNEIKDSPVGSGGGPTPSIKIKDRFYAVFYQLGVIPSQPSGWTKGKCLTPDGGPE
jgi:hypothetical protein